MLVLESSQLQAGLSFSVCKSRGERDWLENSDSPTKPVSPHLPCHLEHWHLELARRKSLSPHQQHPQAATGHSLSRVWTRAKELSRRSHSTITLWYPDSEVLSARVHLSVHLSLAVKAPSLLCLCPYRQQCPSTPLVPRHPRETDICTGHSYP